MTNAKQAAGAKITKPCTCTGFCKGKEGLGELWHCSLDEHLTVYCDSVRKNEAEQKAKQQAEMQSAIDAATAELREEVERLKRTIARSRPYVVGNRDAPYSDIGSVVRDIDSCLTPNQPTRGE